MQDTFASNEIANIDFTKIAALQQKRTLAFVNHFVFSTVQFLNNFTKRCEQKLMHFERKLEKINATMILLEAKLSSIPEVNIPIEIPKSQDNRDEGEKKDGNIIEQKSEISECDKHEVKTIIDSSNNLEYEKFIKMVQVGVPLQAVKLKISLEGLDPKEFENILSK